MPRNKHEQQVCLLLEWYFIISKETHWDLFQHTYVLITRTEEFIIASANYVVAWGVR